MGSKKRLHRTHDEVDEIREYRKLVRFAEEVMTGKHPRVKIPASMFPITPGSTRSNPIIISSPLKPPPPPLSSPPPPPPPATSLKRKRPTNPHPIHPKPPPAPANASNGPTAPRAMLSLPSSNIDFSMDYYKILGVEPHVTTNSINRGYAHKAALYSPTAKSSAWRWTDKNHRVREKVKENWERVENAKRVLTNQELRNAYDAGRETEVVTKKQSSVQSQKQQGKPRTSSPVRTAKRRRAEGKRPRSAREIKLTSKKTKVEHVIEGMEDLHFKSDTKGTGAVNEA